MRFGLNAAIDRNRMTLISVLKPYDTNKCPENREVVRRGGVEPESYGG